MSRFNSVEAFIAAAKAYTKKIGYQSGQLYLEKGQTRSGEKIHPGLDGQWYYWNFHEGLMDELMRDSNEMVIETILNKVYAPGVESLGGLAVLKLINKNGKPSKIAWAALDIENGLDRYPLLDEEDYSRRQTEADIERIKQEIRMTLRQNSPEFFPEDVPLDEAASRVYGELWPRDDINDDGIAIAFADIYGRRPRCPNCDYVLEVVYYPSSYDMLKRFHKAEYEWNVPKERIVETGDDEFEETVTAVEQYRKLLLEYDPDLQPALPGFPRTYPPKPLPIGSLVIHDDGKMTCPMCFEKELE